MGKEKNPPTDTPRHSLPNNPSFVIHTVEGTELKPAESVGKDEPICAPLVDLPPPPDGGWGWVVVFASFMCNLILGEYLSFQFLLVFMFFAVYFYSSLFVHSRLDLVNVVVRPLFFTKLSLLTKPSQDKE